MEPIEKFQIAVGIVVSIATVAIGWQTFRLNDISQQNNHRLKQIEQSLSVNKFNFERVRDIYDRTEKFLISEKQDERRGRALVALIEVLPDQRVRENLLRIIVREADSIAISQNAADTLLTKTQKELLRQKLPVAQTGEYFGNFVIENLSTNDSFRVLEKFGFKDSAGIVWEVREGFVAEELRLPRSFEPLMSDADILKLRRPSVLHQYYASRRERSSKQVHRMFYEASIASGLKSFTAKVLYQAVLLGGERWETVEQSN